MRKIYIAAKYLKAFFLFFAFLISAFWANAGTYYLTAAGAGSAQTPANWNTNPAGGGTAALNFTTNNDIFIIPVGISGTFGANTVFGSGGGSGSGITIQVLGTVTINTGVTITLDGKNGNNSSITVSGTIIFGTTAKVSLNDNDSRNSFILQSGATLKTANALGVVGTNCSIQRTAGANPTVTLSTGANYEFNGTNQATAGLPSTVNDLTFSGSGTKAMPATALTISGNFTTGGTASLTAGNTMNINGNVTLGSGTTFNGGSFTHNVGGNWSNANNDFTAGTSTIIFNGSSSQTITGATTFRNLQVNNSSGITLASNVTVAQSLALTNGIITTGTNTVIISNGGSPSRTNGWVNGNLQQYIASPGTYNYYVGSSTTYRPVTIAFSSVTTPGNLTVSQLAGQHPQIASSGLNSSKALTPYWNLTSGGVVGTYDATFNFVAGDVPSGAATGNFIVRNYNSSWATTTTGTKTSTSTQTTGLTTFGDFAIGETTGPPTVSSQPTDATICSGSNTSFTSASASTPAPTVKWQRSLDNGVNWVDIDGTLDGSVYTNFTTNTLSITNATTALTGYQYRSVYTNINGTVNSNAKTLTVTTPPSATFSYDGSPYGTTLGTQSPTFTGTTGGSFSKTAGAGTLSLNSGNGDITPNTSTAGTYTVTYTIAAAGGCPTYTTTADLTITLAPTAQISYSPDSLCNSDNTSHNVIRTGTGNYINGTSSAYTASPAGLSIDGSTGAVTPNTSTPGTYTVTYNIPADAPYPASTTTTEVTITAAPTASISYPSGNTWCTSDETAQTVSLTGTNVYAGGTFSYTTAPGLSLDPATGDILPSASTAGTYSVTYTTPTYGGCSVSSLPVSITIVSKPDQTLSYIRGSFCLADNTSYTPTAGTAGGTYSSPDGLIINPSTGAFTPGANSVGTYTIIYQIPDSPPCLGVQVVTSVTIDETPTATIDYPNQPYCQAGGTKSVTLLGTGSYSGGTFAKTAGAGTLTLNSSTGDITPSSSTPNIYTVTYTTPNCPVSVSADVEISAAPTATISYATPFCQSDGSLETVTLTGDGSGTYSATGPGTLSIDPNTGSITPSTSDAGTYTVDYTIPASGSCGQVIKSTTVVITPIAGTPTAITVSAGTEPTCQLATGGTTTTYATTSTNSTGFNWSISNASAGSINASTGVMTWANGFSGSVDIQVTANGCNGASPQTVRTVNVSPTVGTPTSITVDAGTEPTCQLTNGSTTTTYGTTATNSTGFNWSLSNGAAGSINATSGVMTWANGFSGSVDIRVTANGCNGPSSQVVRTVTVTPTVGTPTAITISSGTQPTCQLTNGTTTTTYATTATNNTGFNWSLSNGAAGSISSAGVMTWANGFSGSVDIEVTANGCNGPSSQVVRTVNVTPTVGTPTAITVGSGTEPSCQLTNGTTTTTYATTATNSTGFNWSLSTASAGSINSSGVMTWSNGFSGTVDIRVTANGCNGPSAQTTRTVNVIPTIGTPTAITVGSGTEPTCQLTNGTTTTTYATTATNSTGFNWSLSTASAGSINSSGMMTWANGYSGTVNIQVTANGCNGPSSQVSRSVTVLPPFTPTITVSPSTTICLGQTITFTTTGFNTQDTITGGDFSNANPPGWEVKVNGVGTNFPANANNTQPNVWSETNSQTFYGTQYNSQLGGKFVIVNGSQPTTTLETPVFSTVGKTSANLDFYVAYILTAGTTAKIELSTNGGSTYPTTLVQYTSPGNLGTPNGGFTHVIIPLTSYLGMSNLRIRFTYTSSGNSTWAMDNINVTGSYYPITYTWPAGFTVSGNTGSITPTPAGTYTYTLTTSYGGCTATTAITPAVTVSDSVNITAQPSTSPFCVGNNASITVNATGSSLTYQWQYSTTGIGGAYIPVPAAAPYSGVTTAILNFTTPAIALSSNYYRVVLTGTAACGSKTSSPTALKYSNVWMGTTSANWNIGSNWSDGNVASTVCPTVYIPNRTNQPTLSTGPDAVITNLVIDPSAILTVTNSTVTRMVIGGTITNNGRFDVTTGSIEFNGTSNQSIPANVFYTNKIKDLTISNNVNLNGVDSLTGNLTFPSSGKTFATNGNLIIKSTATSTGAVGPMNGNTLTGDVTVERFFSVLRKWRYLSIPTATGQNVKAAWQEGALSSGSNPVPGYGTQVTDAIVPTGGNGFDYFSPDGPSMKWYNGAGYTGITNTFVGIATDEGWMTFVRGDRTAIGAGATPTTTVLRTKGPLFTGTKSYPITAGQFKSIGNPFAAPLDMKKITPAQQFFYVWDPSIGSLGALQYFTLIGSDYYPSPGGGSYTSSATPYNYIQSGLAFFVQGSFTGMLDIPESAKATTTAAGNLSLYRPLSASTEGKLHTNLYAIGSDSSSSLLDGVFNHFADKYSNTIDQFDAKKLSNFSENLAVKTDSQLLAVERRHAIVKEDTIQLNMFKMKAKSYRFEFIGQDFDPSVTAFLEDSYNNTRTPIDINGTSTYNFTVANIPGSWNPDRFRIVFTSAEGALPISFSTVKAYQLNNDISVDWKIENEKNMKQYEVEKSADGQNFTLVTTAIAKLNNGGSVNYQWLDVNAFAGNNYYRIKSVDVNGEIKYSDVVKVVTGKGRSQIMVYPNPVLGGNINLQFINQPAGKYAIRLLDKLGQVIRVKQIERIEGSSTETMQMNKNLAHGSYHLEVTKPDKSKFNIKVIY